MSGRDCSGGMTTGPISDDDAPDCVHCGSNRTHWTDYHGDHDCHCESCGRTFPSGGDRDV